MIFFSLSFYLSFSTWAIRANYGLPCNLLAMQLNLENRAKREHLYPFPPAYLGGLGASFHLLGGRHSRSLPAGGTRCTTVPDDDVGRRCQGRPSVRLSDAPWPFCRRVARRHSKENRIGIHSRRNAATLALARFRRTKIFHLFGIIIRQLFEKFYYLYLNYWKFFFEEAESDTWKVLLDLLIQAKYLLQYRQVWKNGWENIARFDERKLEMITMEILLSITFSSRLKIFFLFERKKIERDILQSILFEWNLSIIRILLCPMSFLL